MKEFIRLANNWSYFGLFLFCTLKDIAKIQYLAGLMYIILTFMNITQGWLRSYISQEGTIP